MVSVGSLAGLLSFLNNRLIAGLDLDRVSWRRQPILRDPRGHQFRSADRTLCANGNLLHQRHKPFQIGSHGLIFNRRS